MLGPRIPHPGCALPLCLLIPKRPNFVRQTIGSTRLFATKLEQIVFALHNDPRKSQLFRASSLTAEMAKRKVSSVSGATKRSSVGQSTSVNGTDLPLIPEKSTGVNGTSPDRRTIEKTAHVSTLQSSRFGEEASSGSPLSEAVSTPDVPESFEANSRRPTKTKDPEIIDPEADADVSPDEEEVKEALSRPPAVNSAYLPLPWKGRLGYVSTALPSMLTQSTDALVRRVSVHIFELRLLLYSALELVASHQSWKTGIP